MTIFNCQNARFVIKVKIAVEKVSREVGFFTYFLTILRLHELHRELCADRLYGREIADEWCGIRVGGVYLVDVMEGAVALQGIGLLFYQLLIIISLEISTPATQFLAAVGILDDLRFHRDVLHQHVLAIEGDGALADYEDVRLACFQDGEVIGKYERLVLRIYLRKLIYQDFLLLLFWNFLMEKAFLFHVPSAFWTVLYSRPLIVRS